MIKKTLMMLLLMCLAMTASAQWYHPWHKAWNRADDTSRTAVHMSVGSMVGAGFGNTEAIGWLAPSFKWRATERLTLRGGFAVAGSLLPQGYELQGRGARSLVPVRQGTELGAMWAQAEYRASDNLLLWASVLRATGFAQPLWAGSALPVDATAISGGLAYRMSENSILSMHFRFVHDEYGYLLHPPYGHTYYGPLAPEIELFSGPWPW